jgi:hypothetical protein
MTTLEWALQLLLLGLLVIAIPFTIRLERQLAALRRERGALEAGAAGIQDAARVAEAAIIRLRAAAEGAGKGVAEKIAAAEPLREDLRFLTERAETLADRLDAAVRAARPAAAEPDPRVPASAAERDLLRALALGRGAAREQG